MAPQSTPLSASWGKAPCILSPGMLDLSSARTDLDSIERLLRRMPEERLRVRTTGNGPASGSPTRIMMSELRELRAPLLGGATLHVQATDLHRYDDGFAEVGRQFRARLEDQIPELRAPMTRMTVGLFLSSGGAVAPFHADQEHNFLSQVVGDKKVHMFPPEDLEIFPCISRERLAFEDEHMLDTYRPELEARGEVAQLVPGTTLYHPPMGPHWVDTGRNSYSLSVTLSFITPSVDRTLLLHKLNRQMRRLGLQPAPVGRRPQVDRAKLVLARMARGIARLQRGA